MTTDIRPFTVDVPQTALDDLTERLSRTRWSRQLPGDWDRGVHSDYLRELVDHWCTGFDWREHEARLNASGSSITTIDDHDVHFLHVRSPEPDALPLLLNHGWPNSVFEFAELVGPLTDPRAHGHEGARAFHVVAPSVPGFGFSDPPKGTGWSVSRVAGMFTELMRRLGYDRYGVQGGDLGAYLAPEMAKAAPDAVVGVYVMGGLGFPTERDVPDMSADELATYHEMQKWAGTGVDHHALLRAAPQTFAHAWNDSPVGLLAWLIEKFKQFTITVELPDQAIDRDLLLANATLYWLTDTSGSSSWFMYESTETTWPEGQSLVPSGVYGGGPDLWRRLAERDNTIVHWPQGNPGGHFVAMEEPHAVAADLRTFFDLVVPRALPVTADR